MTRKEQEQNKIKGFSEKWSRRVYKVIKKTKMKKNEFFHYYKLEGASDTYLRHELLKVRGVVDTEVPELVRYVDKSIGDLYDPADDDPEWDHE